MERHIKWVSAARKDFLKFPAAVREQADTALGLAALGTMARIVKPMKGLGSGVLEIRVPYRSDAYRVVYAVSIGRELWVVHAFQKKATQGIKTPKHEIDLIKSRLKKIKEQL